MKISALTLAVAALFLVAKSASAQSGHDGHGHGPVVMPELNAEQSAAAAADYKQYCALCHGDNREGGANDHAPSLKSKSLMGTGVPFQVLHSIQYGRAGTPMASYLDELGGPMSLREIARLTLWLYHESGAELTQLGMETIKGNAAEGAKTFVKECSTCHGTRDENKTGPILTNPATLAVNHDPFLHYAISNGRDGTKMPAFAEKLSPAEINNVVAFLRSSAGGWQAESVELKAPPEPNNYPINPDGPEPEFNLQNGLYVSSADLDAQIKAGTRMILLDTRPASMWQLSHIDGAVPLPYYTSQQIFSGLPKDTWIVAYCECPRAAAESVVNYLRSQGYSKTAVLYEGIYGWTSLGYPIQQGKAEKRAAE